MGRSDTAVRACRPVLPAQIRPAAVCTPLAEDLLPILRSCGVPQCYRAGQVIFYEGHTPLGIYVHESGRVRLMNENGMEFCCDGPCAMGLRSRVAGVPHSHTALPLGDVRITFLSRSAWNLFIQENPSLSLEAIPIGIELSSDTIRGRMPPGRP